MLRMFSVLLWSYIDLDVIVTFKVLKKVMPRLRRAGAIDSALFSARLISDNQNGIFSVS